MTAETAQKGAGKHADIPKKEAGSDPGLTWLPPDSRTGRPIDGRSADARFVRSRLDAYYSELTGNGRRKLTAAEVAAVRLVVSLEYEHSHLIASQSRGRPVSSTELTSLGSTWKRQIEALGLSMPGGIGGAVPAGSAAPGADPESGVRTGAQTVFHLPYNGRDSSPQFLNLAHLTDSERVTVVPILERLAAEDAAERARGPEVRRHEPGLVDRLKGEIARLKARLSARSEPVRADIPDAQEGPEPAPKATADDDTELPGPPADEPDPPRSYDPLNPPGAERYSGGNLNDWAKRGSW